MKVLITGIAGKLGRMVAEQLLLNKCKVVGIDRRPWPDAPKGISAYQHDIRKRPAEDVFRKFRPDAVIHMATVTHFSSRAEERYRINLKGTQAVFEFAETYGVSQVLFVGRHTIYGAAADAPLYHTESDPPLAVSTFPALADLMAADLFAASSLWKFPHIRTSVLRICYTLGPSHHGTLANFLRGPNVPLVLGFDPLYQFMHEIDAVNAICLALEKNLQGVFNVAGPQPVPLSLLIRETGRRRIYLPEPVLDRCLGRFGLPRLPAGAHAHLKYTVTVDGSSFSKATGFSHQYDEIQTMGAFRWT